MEQILLIGSGGHAKSVIDSIETLGVYEIIGFVAEKLDSDFEYRGYKVVGTDADLNSLYHKGIKRAFVCVGYMGKGNARDNIYHNLKKIGFTLPSIIDATAIIAKDARIGEGTFIGKRTVVNASATIGKMAIINTAAIVEHDCMIEDFSHIAVNATLCGAVSVGSHCLIGANATIRQGITIGERVVLGAGAVVTSNIGDDCVAVGVPAKVIKQTKSGEF